MPVKLVLENVWLDKSRYDDAERDYFEALAAADRVSKLEEENSGLLKIVNDLTSKLSTLETRVNSLETLSKAKAATKPTAKPDLVQPAKPAPAKDDGDDDDDDVDLFGSEEDEAANELRDQRLKEYAEKKSKKKAIIAKSSVVLEVKPWDDETDMAKLEECVRAIEMDGLLWGTSKLVPVAFNVKKLQIVCVVEDDKVSIEELSEKIEANEDYVQSVDVAAFNKI